MNCPFCDGLETKVIDKRDNENATTRRRRECLTCSRRFTTYERVELIEMQVLKKDGRRESFNVEKIRAGICRACEKRPVSLKEIDRLAKEIEMELRSQKETEIPSHSIGELVMEKLKNFDQVAYIRFASVYRSFADVESFEQEARQLLV